MGALPALEWSLLLGLNIMVIVISAWLWSRAFRLRKSCLPAWGTIVEYVEVQNDGETWAARIQFRAGNGRAFEFQDSLTSAGKPRAGKRVLVLYQTVDPRRAWVGWWWRFYAGPLWLSVFAGSLGFLLLVRS